MRLVSKHKHISSVRQNWECLFPIFKAELLNRGEDDTKIVDVITALTDYGTQVTIYDPWANPAEVMHEYGLVCHAELNTERSRSTASNPSSISKHPSPITHHPSPNKYDAIVLGVAHQEFKILNLEALKKDNTIVYDVKGILGDCDGTL